MRGLHSAWVLYGQPQAAVLMVVHQLEVNQFDQRQLGYALWER